MAEDRNSDHLYSANTKAGAKSRVAIHHVLEGNIDSGVKLEAPGMQQNAHQVSPTPLVIQSSKPNDAPQQLAVPQGHRRYPVGGKPQYIIYRGPPQGAPAPPTVVISTPGGRPGSHGSASVPDTKRSTPSPRGGQYRVSPIPDRQSPASRDSPVSHTRVSPVPRDASGVIMQNVIAQREALNQMNKARDTHPGHTHPVHSHPGHAHPGHAHPGHAGGLMRVSPNQRVSPVSRDSLAASRTSPVPRESAGLLRVSPVNQNRASPTLGFRNASSPASQRQTNVTVQRKSPSPGLLQGILQGNVMEAQGAASRGGITNSHSPPPPSLPAGQPSTEPARKPVFSGPIPVPTSFTLPLERTENPLLLQIQQQQQAALMKLAARGNPSLAKGKKGRDNEEHSAASTSDGHSQKSRNAPRHIDIPASVSTALQANHVQSSTSKDDAQPSSSSKAPFQSSAASAESSQNSVSQPLTIDTSVITTIAKTIAEMIGLKSPSQLSQIKQKADTSTTHSPPGNMPRLHREVSSSSRSKETPPRPVEVKKEVKDEKKPVDLAQVENPFNMRVNNLSNFPSGQTGYRATYRSQTVAIHRAKAGSITSAAKSLDILRQNLQKYINREIDDIIQRYLTEYFEPAVVNIKMNNGETSVNDDHVRAVCRQMLEEAKKMYPDESTRSSTPDVSENSTEVEGITSNPNVLQENSFVRQNKYKVFNIKKRRGSTDSEKSNKSIPHKKRKGRPPLHTSGRLTPSKQSKSDMVRKEGPKWDPVRLKEDTYFIMGAKANKALGLGQTRGRLYIKHPDVFKYSGDQEDKNYLHENSYMPATGGKAYMLLLEDIKELCENDEYRGNPALQLNELVGFTVPPWMLEKMKIQMQALRTDYKPSKPPIISLNNLGIKDEDVDENEPPLPFASLQDTSQVSKGSPAVDLLSTEDQEEELAADVSPFHAIGSNFDVVSPAPDVSPQASDLGIDEEATFTGFIND